MMAAAHRDLPDVPALQAPTRGVEAHLDSVATALSDDLGPPARGTLRHLIGFPARQSLRALGWSRDEILRAGAAWIAGARGGDTREQGARPGGTP